jgi:Ca2+-binding RTX toxin-like protein
MATVIAIESHPVTFRGFVSPYEHLYLVKTVTDAEGDVVQERVIRGDVGEAGELTTIADVDLATSPDRRGSDTPEERHRRELDLGGRNADDVWNIMVQHAVNIDRANLPYGFDIFQQIPGADVNSNTVVASVLHSVGISLARNFPPGISPSDTPLYNEIAAMDVNDVLKGTARGDEIRGGVGQDRVAGYNGNDKLIGNTGNDIVTAGNGRDRLDGGDGDDRLHGGSGIDILRGGAGADAFVFSTALQGSTNVDAIRDFSVAEDSIFLARKIFSVFTADGPLNSEAFWTGTAAHDTDDRVIYNRNSGAVYYDADGIGAGNQVQFAQVSTGLTMTAADFVLV